MNRKKRVPSKIYAIAKHHAWAGSVLLTILLTIRIFLETTANEINNIMFIIPGVLLVIYILIALVLTYKYRRELTENHIIQDSIKLYSNRDRKALKNQVKIEKKNVKEKTKQIKKQDHNS